MKREIKVYENKTLKLNNVLFVKIDDTSEMLHTIQMFYQYIKTKNIKIIGPKISHISLEVGENGVPIRKMILFQQLEKPVLNIEGPYVFQEELKIECCLYARYVGERQFLNVAHQKLIVYAYENGFLLKEGYYNIVLDDNEKQTVVDVFMEYE